MPMPPHVPPFIDDDVSDDNRVTAGWFNGIQDRLYTDLPAEGGAALVGFIQAGTGAVARLAQARMRDRVSVKDFGAVGDGATNDATAINNTILAVQALGGGTVWFPPGIYITQSTINIPASSIGIRLLGPGRGNGSSNGAIIQYTGTISANTAVVKATGDEGFLANSIEEMSIDANSRAGYCLHIDAWHAGVTKVSKNWRFQHCEFSYPTRAHVLLGQDTWNGSDFTPATIDLDAHLNVWEQCSFTCMSTTAWGVVINVANNAYQTVLRDCTWEGSTGDRAGVINYIRQLSGNSLELYNVYFPPIPGTNANAASVRQHAGSVLMVGCESEEGRWVKREVIATAYGNLTMIGCNTNDATDLSGTPKKAINDLSTFPITLVDCLFDTGAFPRNIVSDAPISALNVTNTTWTTTEAATAVTAAPFFTTGLYERSRSTPVGEWIDVAFDGTNFTGGGTQTWTLTIGDQFTFKYTLIGKTMKIAFQLSTTTVGGTPDPELRILIPGGFTAAANAIGAMMASDNGGTQTASFCLATLGLTYISCYKNPTFTANWTNSTDATYVFGEITVEVV